MKLLPTHATFFSGLPSRAHSPRFHSAIRYEKCVQWHGNYVDFFPPVRSLDVNLMLKSEKVELTVRIIIFRGKSTSELCSTEVRSIFNGISIDLHGTSFVWNLHEVVFLEKTATKVCNPM